MSAPRNTHPPRLRAPGTVALVALAGANACAPALSTQYSPRDPARMALVVDGGDLKVVKGGRPLLFTLDLTGSSTIATWHPGALKGAFSCAPAAVTEIAAALDDLDSAKAWMGVLGVMVRANLDSALARLVDAVNIHNDTPACTKGQS